MPRPAKLLYNFTVKNSLGSGVPGANVRFTLDGGYTNKLSDGAGVVSGFFFPVSMPTDVPLLITKVGFQDAALTTSVGSTDSPPDKKMNITEVSLVEG